MELARQCDWAESPASLFHYRDKQTKRNPYDGHCSVCLSACRRLRLA